MITQEKAEKIGESIVRTITGDDYKLYEKFLEGLSAKQAAFALNFCLTHTGNATRAAQAAEYKGNENTLGVVGSGNLRKPKVKAAISAIKAYNASLSVISSDEITADFQRYAVKAENKGDLVNANRSKENIGKHLGWFEADNKQNRPQTLIVTGLDRLAELEVERRLIVESQQSDLAIDGDVIDVTI